jgi:hypothetical protein
MRELLSQAPPKRDDVVALVALWPGPMERSGLVRHKQGAERSNIAMPGWNRSLSPTTG